jgi:hypothetical protein
LRYIGSSVFPPSFAGPWPYEELPTSSVYYYPARLGWGGEYVAADVRQQPLNLRYQSQDGLALDLILRFFLFAAFVSPPKTAIANRRCFCPFCRICATRPHRKKAIEESPRMEELFEGGYMESLSCCGSGQSRESDASDESFAIQERRVGILEGSCWG